MEREAKLRAIVRKARDCKDVDIDCKTENDDGSNSDVEIEMKTDSHLPQNTTLEKSMSRPMWAMTEEQATKVVEHAELDATNELLDFANGLNFDKYINDSEVSALIQNVRSRISELEANIYSASNAEPTQCCVNTTPKSSKLRLTAERLSGLPDNVAVTQDDCVSVARSVLESETGKSIGAIHSHKSLGAIAERATNALKEDMDNEEIMQPPLIVKHSEDVGARLEGKNTVSNLPYMHRNPAV